MKCELVWPDGGKMPVSVGKSVLSHGNNKILVSQRYLLCSERRPDDALADVTSF